MLFNTLLELCGDKLGFCVLGASTKLADEHLNNREGDLEIYLEPYLCISSYGGSSSIKGVNFDKRFDNQPWQALKESIEPGMLCAGFISYEALHLLEEVLQVKQDLYQLPDYCFYLYRKRLKVARRGGQVTIEKTSLVMDRFEPFWTFQPPDQIEFQGEVDTFASREDLDLLAKYSNFTQQQYQSAVDNIKELILDGKVYQVNLSQQFCLPYHFGANAYYSCLRSINPAQFEAYFNLGAAQIVSSSPELFFELRNGTVLASPIKGTRARSNDDDQEIGAKALAASSKDRAELAMIVDLIRNDLGRVSQIGSVEVLADARVEALPFLYHLVSDIRSRLTSESDIVALIKAIFPSGSISGAPKIAAMNIISKIEGAKRGVFSGAIGVITAPDQARFSVAIRTACIREQLLILQAGGGITIDSDSKAEYRESMLKARAMFKAWRMASGL